ncbi:MAG: Flp pilus assembly protein CpaB [Chloroflexi bacterium]|nr:Flp pilus assembly protein CpaB [Chloroflexota bacterium]
MNRAGRILLIFGVLLSIVSGLTVLVVLSLSQPQPAEVPTTKVVVAFQNISSRSEISPDQVGVADWPRALPTPTGGFPDSSSVIGKVATAPIPPGQPITDKLLIDKGDAKETHSNAALIIEKGSVAAAMPVTIKSSVAEAIQAGDRVDVLATFRSPNNGSGVATQRLLADILVLQVGPWPSANAKQQSTTGTSVLTLQVKEQDAAVLLYAEEFATEVSLVLRSAGDHDLPTLEPVTFDYINQRFGFKLPR